MRIAVAALALSAAGMVAIVQNEGYSDQAVIPVQGDKPTLGFGSTTREDGQPVRLGDRTTPVKALQRSLAYLQNAEADMKKSLQGVELTQGEYDIYFDWRYQYGYQAWLDSPMLRDLREGDYSAACDGFLQYHYMTSPKPIAGWEPYKFDAQRRPLRWRFDCAAPGNRICGGVWKRSQERHAKCRAELQQ